MKVKSSTILTDIEESNVLNEKTLDMFKMNAQVFQKKKIIFNFMNDEEGEYDQGNNGGYFKDCILVSNRIQRKGVLLIFRQQNAKYSVTCLNIG